MKQTPATRFFLLFGLILSLSGCATYFKRKECDSSNWFEVGRKVALRGERLNSDNFVLECRRVEASVNDTQLDLGFKSGMESYCQEESVFLLGKGGEFFNPEMCSSTTSLKREHVRGVKEYCKASNGQNAGRVGKLYNKICPADYEAAFLPEFNKGRKIYLQAQIAEREARIKEVESDIRAQTRERSSLEFQLATAPPVESLVPVTKVDPLTNRHHVEMERHENIGARARRDSIEANIRETKSRIYSLKGQQQKLRDEVRQLNVENSML